MPSSQYCPHWCPHMMKDTTSLVTFTSPPSSVLLTYLSPVQLWLFCFTRKLAYIYPRIHSYALIYPHTLIYPRIHSYTLVYTHIPSYTRIYPRIHSYALIYTHMPSYTLVYTHVPSYTLIYTIHYLYFL